ncbi:RNA polymerase sigma factor [Crocinitomix catalasitica]|uniref:RNA polymerase sigma factor n=1 Tax=Crocinitomix catalasitica TaxID=184607 RepID=UPI0004853151|nr:RNA polymerase sigma factor [Crocinitomix catalasitica]
MATLISDELISRLRNDDINALGELYNLLSKKIYNRCLFILKDQNLAEDATQELFLKAFRHIGSLKDDKKIEGWLNRMAYNYCMDYFRKEKKTKDQLDVLVNEEEPLSIIDNIEFLENSKVKKDKLVAEIEALNETDRMILVMYYWEGMLVSEIAEMMDLGISAVKMKLSRTRSKLKENLEKEGISSAVELTVLVILNLI